MDIEALLRETTAYFDALDSSPVDDEAEFKLPEGSTRRRNGVDYVLQGSRWHRSEVQEAIKKKNLDMLGTLLFTS